MGVFRPPREGRGEDPFLLPKMMLFIAGAIFGMIAMATGRFWILWLAFMALGFGLVLRIVARRRADAARRAPLEDGPPAD
ncbi:MAG: hypothetical protein WEF86_14545 [Gemmatimonadota bacterium]